MRSLSEHHQMTSSSIPYSFLSSLTLILIRHDAFYDLSLNNILVCDCSIYRKLSDTSQTTQVHLLETKRKGGNNSRTSDGKEIWLLYPFAHHGSSQLAAHGLNSTYSQDDRSTGQSDWMEEQGLKRDKRRRDHHSSGKSVIDIEEGEVVCGTNDKKSERIRRTSDAEVRNIFADDETEASHQIFVVIRLRSMHQISPQTDNAYFVRTQSDLASFQREMAANRHSVVTVITHLTAMQFTVQLQHLTP
ncbi:hypothetical protein PROFUN_12522 [Planoprotostelium fungivorum]|uniref:Uncharacterized protein n=1 Tax=Planoprotostelium fungivorum TaxID=1890364 RepID=A0A2P6MS24_9EUKA|nr:hypothetical protein PROFUN_12522 [Planoprotostelium fungivorum]